MTQDGRGDPPLAASGGVRGALRLVLGFAETRVRLAANEFEEQLLRLCEVWVWAVAAVLFLAIALLLGSLFIVLAFWDTHRVLSAGLLTALYLVAGGICVLMVRSRLAVRPKFLSVTLGEIAKDKQELDRP
jgi:uncharacterized membrane protein YqjE